MTVFPGPAMVVLPLGLAMLAVVFGWARRLLVFGADEGAEAAHAWKDASNWIKVATVATAAAVAGILAWTLL
ncbi:MAG: PGPGW domain-containing protein [Actinobacteria bacterium]|nr:PGPGW domain-containing protein [Actinomycetota bacterium]